MANCAHCNAAAHTIFGCPRDSTFQYEICKLININEVVDFCFSLRVCRDRMLPAVFAMEFIPRIQWWVQIWSRQTGMHSASVFFRIHVTALIDKFTIFTVYFCTCTKLSILLLRLDLIVFCCVYHAAATYVRYLHAMIAVNFSVRYMVTGGQRYNRIAETHWQSNTKSKSYWNKTHESNES